jgi:hypothetical protein
MFKLHKLFPNDDKVADRLKLVSTSNIETLEDIRVHGRFEYSVFLRNLEDSPEGVEIPFSNHMEEVLAERGELSENWQYFINSYNFRGKWNLDTDKKIKIACFGDSFTFGDGLREEVLHVQQLANFFPEAELYNLGRGGASVERIARIFSVFTKFVNIDIAVITLPHIHREFWIDDKGVTIDLIPNEKHNHFEYMKPFFELPENYQKIKLSLNVNYILDIANILGIKVLFTSWDEPTYRLLQICAPKNTANKMFPNDLDNKMARDKQHPGPKSQLRHAKNIRKEIYDRAWIQR